MEELPEPISKQDKFLHNIADSTPDIDDIEAISRQDKYLKYIALNGGTSGGNANQKIGTWSPTLVNYTDSAHPNTVVDPTYSVVYSNAYYLKMGKLVYINFRIKVEITDIGTGFACVAGLPFNPDQNMIGQSFCISENSAVTESDGVVYDGVVGQLYPDIYLEIYNERHIPAISLRTDNGIQAKTFKVGTNWISYSGCYVCDDSYVPPQDSLVTIEHGGTSGKTAEEARTNLDIYSKSEVDDKVGNTLSFKTINQYGTDFNDYKEVGFYSIYNPLYNVPDTSMSGNYSYSLIVNKGQFKNNTYDIDQIAVSQNGDMYIRHYTRDFSIWESWIRISNTNSKPLEVGRGGTGANNASEARINLDVYSKNEVDSLIPDEAEIVQNTGTSETAVMSQKAVTDAIPTKLIDLSGVLSIEQGGTGATNAKDAITNLGAVPIYTGVTDFISLPATTSEIIQAMPYPSILMTWIDTTSNSITDLPCSYGVLTIHKRSSSRLQILYNRSYEGVVNGNNLYFGNYNTSSKTVTWNRIFTSYSGCQVPIENGGTGASTSKQALINLGIPEIPLSGTYILQASDGVLSWVQS